jgi:hypothetical protein
MYNNSISFTSVKTQIDSSVQGQRGVHVFRISGRLTHLISSILPDNPDEAGFSQIFVVGSGGTEEERHRVTMAEGALRPNPGAQRLQESTVRELMAFMYQHNTYAKMYKVAREVLNKTRAHTIALQGVPKPGSDPKQYNEPSIDEVAVIVQGEGDAIAKRQIALHVRTKKKGDLKVISDQNSGYFALHYPILFPLGSQQWDNMYRALYHM